MRPSPDSAPTERRSSAHRGNHMRNTSVALALSLAMTVAVASRASAQTGTMAPAAPALTPEQIKASEELAARYDEAAAKEQSRLAAFKNRPLAAAIQRTFNVYNNYLVMAAQMMAEADYAFHPTPEVRIF